MAKAALMIAAAAAAVVLLAAGGAPAAPPSRGDDAQMSELSAQRRVRPRTRIRIYAPYAYPGPNAVRQCNAWIEPEWRVSGTVIVPRMRCWWVPG
jgi:hypothetical protein